MELKNESNGFIDCPIFKAIQEMHLKSGLIFKTLSQPLKRYKYTI